MIQLNEKSWRVVGGLGPIVRHSRYLILDRRKEQIVTRQTT